MTRGAAAEACCVAARLLHAADHGRTWANSGSRFSDSLASKR
jgi:hypothetical protein